MVNKSKTGKKVSEKALVEKALAEQPKYIETLRNRVDQLNAKTLDLINENEALKNELIKLEEEQQKQEQQEPVQVPEARDIESLLKELAEIGRKFKVEAGTGDVIKIKPYINSKGKPALRASIIIDGSPYITIDGEIKLIGKGAKDKEE